MKLGIAYNVFNGGELLESSLKQFRVLADFICVVYQTVSNSGLESDSNLINEIELLKYSGLIDKAIYYKPDLNAKPKSNETKKRNIGLKYAKKAKCSHFMSVDCDEFYEKEAFIRAKNIIENNNYDSSACELVNYFQSPCYQMIEENKQFVPFIFKIEYFKNIKQGCKFPVVVDSTRAMKVKIFYLFKPEELVMHHMSYVRKDINSFKSKLLNSPNRSMFIDYIDEYIEYFNNWNPSKSAMNPHQFRKSNAVPNIKSVVNIFNISTCYKRSDELSIPDNVQSSHIEEKNIKIYNILITNHSLKRMRGSEIYCYYLAKAFSENHKVSVYSPEYGKVSDKMKPFANLLAEPKGNFDIIFYNHNNTYNENIHSNCKINTIHGIFPKLEKPIPGLDAYVAISKEIQEYYKDMNLIYIPNCIDTNKYISFNEHHFPKRLLYLSNYKSNLSKLLRLIAISLGIRFKRLGGDSTKEVFEIVNDLNWADVVVCAGRSALEAMSCKRKIVIADKRKYADYGMDGFLTLENVEISSNNNFTGRALKKEINFFTLRHEIKMALKDSSSWEREYIQKYHEISMIANKYIELAEIILKAKSN